MLEIIKTIGSLFAFIVWALVMLDWARDVVKTKLRRGK